MSTETESNVGINKLISTISYMTSPTLKSVCCELVLHNGCVVHGTALVASNDLELANRMAFRTAKSKLMEFEAYATHDRMHRSVPSRKQSEGI
jgi:hypothetical protein